MKLCYVDETGNTGRNLLDPQQPHYVLGGVIVDATEWRDVHMDLRKVVLGAASTFEQEVLSAVKTQDKTCRYWSKKLLKSTFDWRSASSPERGRLRFAISYFFTSRFEIHSQDVFPGHGAAEGVALSTRLAVVDDMISILEKHALPVIVTRIDKQRHARKYVYPDPVNELAFMLLVEQMESFLRGLTGDKTGLIVADDQGGARRLKEDLRRYQLKGTKYYYGTKITNIIDAVHFVDSAVTYCVQMSDIVTYLYTRNVRRDKRLTAQFNRIRPRIRDEKVFP